MSPYWSNTEPGDYSNGGSRIDLAVEVEKYCQGIVSVLRGFNNAISFVMAKSLTTVPVELVKAIIRGRKRAIESGFIPSRQKEAA